MTIVERIYRLQHQMAETARACQRNPEDIRLMAVSKGQPATAISEAFAAGITDVGENYWQEAKGKWEALWHLPLIWHFIGPLQSNKSRDIARHFDWVHSVDREKTARLLAFSRPADKPPLNICIQINLDEERSKSGINVSEVLPFIHRIKTLPNLNLRGFMAIPKPTASEEAQYASFQRLNTLLQQTNQHVQLHMDTLSMGMSDDLNAAIRAGSTIIRIGRAIFGERRETGMDR